MPEQNNTEVGVTADSPTQDISNLEARVLRIEKALIRAGYLPKEYFEGEDITNASWSDSSQPGGIAGFNVVFTYRCQHCHELHNGSTFIPSRTKDGLVYNIQGTCREYSAMRIWKNPPAGV